MFFLKKISLVYSFTPRWRHQTTFTITILPLFNPIILVFLLIIPYNYYHYNYYHCNYYDGYKYHNPNINWINKRQP